MKTNKVQSLDKNPDYKSWIKSQSFELTPSQIEQTKEKIKIEVKKLMELSVNHRLLFMKQVEIANWLKNKRASDLQWVKRMIWQPEGKSDFRRITPQLIKINNDFQYVSKNLWGEDFTTRIKPSEPYAQHWDTLLTLVSSSPNNGSVGRQMRYLVIDKNTKQYLGVICISSAMYRIRAIHDEIGWDREAIKKQKGSRLNCIANGQAIVPTQPFGSAFLGGKLLSLLCLSKEVADAWEVEYGDKLVAVHTTSLYGSEAGTQYDNLTPYWHKLPKDTSSESPIRLTSETYSELCNWLRHEHTEMFYKIFVKKNKVTGMLQTREGKTAALTFAYRQLGLTKVEFNSKEARGIYSSFLYQNSIDYLNGRIQKEELIPAFSNSIEDLTEFWRFGSMGDTTKPTSEIIKEKKKPEKIRKKVQMKGQTKGRVDSKTTLLPSEIEWYLDLPKMTWDEIQNKYPEKRQASETASLVQ